MHEGLDLGLLSLNGALQSDSLLIVDGHCGITLLLGDLFPHALSFLKLVVQLLHFLLVFFLLFGKFLVLFSKSLAVLCLKLINYILLFVSF